MGLSKHDRVKIRNTHPALYRSIMTLSMMSVLLAVNFFRSNPTFNPFGIPKNLVGVVFLLLGVWQLIFLNGRFRALRMVRLGLAVSFGVMFIWGVANTQQSFAGNASFQLPILYLTLAALHRYLLIESPVNPMTQRAAP